jgi:hypothetical protein
LSHSCSDGLLVRVFYILCPMHYALSMTHGESVIHAEWRSRIQQSNEAMLGGDATLWRG